MTFEQACNVFEVEKTKRQRNKHKRGQGIVFILSRLFPNATMKTKPEPAIIKEALDNRNKNLNYNIIR